MLKVAFIVPPYVELLDLAGPAQVFTEVNFTAIMMKMFQLPALLLERSKVINWLI